MLLLLLLMMLPMLLLKLLLMLLLPMLVLDNATNDAAATGVAAPSAATYAAANADTIATPPYGVRLLTKVMRYMCSQCRGTQSKVRMKHLDTQCTSGLAMPKMKTPTNDEHQGLHD